MKITIELTVEDLGILRRAVVFGIEDGKEKRLLSRDEIEVLDRFLVDSAPALYNEGKRKPRDGGAVCH